MNYFFIDLNEIQKFYENTSNKYNFLNDKIKKVQIN